MNCESAVYGRRGASRYQDPRSPEGTELRHANPIRPTEGPMKFSGQRWFGLSTLLGRNLALLAFSLLLSIAHPLFAQTGLTGFWVLRIPTGDGNYRETFLVLAMHKEILQPIGNSPI